MKSWKKTENVNRGGLTTYLSNGRRRVQGWGEKEERRVQRLWGKKKKRRRKQITILCASPTDVIGFIIVKRLIILKV